MSLSEIVGGLVLIVGVFVLFAILLTVPTYFLWNWLMPTIFNLNKITLLQALGVSMLSGILFRTSGSKWGK